MNSASPIGRLVESLQNEIAGAQPGSTQGQFPILDLFRCLRDEAAGKPEFADLCTCCDKAWEEIVQIVESGQPFKAEHVEWLKTVLAQLQGLTGVSKPAPAAQPVASSEPSPQPPQPEALQPRGPAEETPLTLDIASDADLLREFVGESRDHLDNIERGVLVLETQPKDAETLNTIFRAFHTFKGGAGFLNLMPVNRLAHILESLLDLARQGKHAIDRETIDLILRGRDTLKHFVDEIEAQVNGKSPVSEIRIPIEQLKAEVQRAIEQAGSAKAATVAAADPVPAPTPKADGAPGEEELSPAPASAAAPSATPHPATGGKPAVSSRESSAMIKLDTGKLDSLLDLVGEMVIAQSLVAPDLNQVASSNPQFARNVAQMGRITKELQRVSMSMRMIPIRGLFQKMARVVRDIGAKQNKSVQLVTSGEDTELDRSVVEELNDPLLHMIRNSMDHGIESPELRAARGKTPGGTINLRAYHQGGNIVIEISDDGAGLNRDRILAKAVERGLTAADSHHSDEEIYNFIFAPGFSTADKITDLSGRGVGLDVVNRNITKLRGCVDISSQPGKGTVFKITLPVTLAIIDALIVKVGDHRYIIPTLSVRESFRPQAEAISTIQNRAEVVNVRGRLIPLLRLHELFGLNNAVTKPAEGIIVVVQSGASLQCLLVDALLHKQEVVIKNLNDIMVHKNRALAGASILGDGQVGLILDVNSLVHQEYLTFAKAA